MLQALREWHRVLRFGGWIAFSCFGGLARQTINELVIGLLAPHGVGDPELNAPLNSPEKCCAMVEAAGFKRVTVQIAREQQFATEPDVSFRQAWASGTRFDLALPPAVVSAIKTQYQTHFEQLLAAQDR